jgi:redox-sensitive bicupin YhaK (pirin superfamily)
MSHLVRRDADIAGGSGSWYAARWHFSFGPYRDPDWNGIGPLRVLNDDLLVPGGVWPMHPHQDVQSLTWVVEGRFGHDDSLGNGGELTAGGVQVMTFGPQGAEHSERNDDPDRRLRFLQFWILADRHDIPSAVQQWQTTEVDRTDRWLTIMSPHGEDGLDLHQDARVRVARVGSGVSLPLEVAADRAAYLYVIDGAIEVALSGGSDATSGVTTSPGLEQLGTGDALVVIGAESADVRGVLPSSELWVADVPLDFTPHGLWAGHAH